MLGKEPWFIKDKQMICRFTSKYVHRVTEKNIKYILLHTGDNNYATTLTL